MAITIDWGTRIIYIPRNDLTLIQSSPVEIRELNLNWFRLQLKDLEDSEEGMIFPDTHRHNTEVYLGGLTFARVIEIINDYTLTFEDGQYAVNLVGANSNVGDRVNVNQVSVRSANSAGLISSPAVEYSSYNEGVTIDIESSFNGTVFPIGTPQAPVNNMADAILICQYRGFNTIYVKRSMIIDSGGDYHGYSFIGESYTKTLITVDSDANVFECEFRNAQLAGTLDGGSVLRNCRIFNLDYIDGIIEDCILAANGRILLSGTRFANIINCVSGRLDTLADMIPIIDMGGSGTSLGMRNYSGAIQIINKSGPENIDIDLSSGVVILNSTVTGGTIQVRGSGQLIDNSNGAIVDSAGLISKASIVEAIGDTIGPQIEYASFENEVHIDANSTYSGTAFPNGTAAYPVNNLTDAKAIAVERGFGILEIVSDFYINTGENIDEFTIKADNYEVLTIASGVSSTNTNFEKISLYGELSGTWNVLTDCWSYDLTNFAGWLRGGSFTTITLAPYNDDSAGQSFFDNIVPMYPENTSTIVMNNNTFIACTDLNGDYEIRNCTSGSLATIGLTSGGLLLDNSCIGGDIIISGNAILIDNSEGSNVDSIGLMSKTTVVEAIDDTIGPKIEYSSFNNCVTIDVTHGSSGTTYPKGTPLDPVNNLTDATIIAANRGFVVLSFKGNYIFESTTNISNYTLVGEGAQKSIFTLMDGSIMAFCKISEAKVTGMSLGIIGMENCHVIDYGSSGAVPSSNTIIVKNSLVEGNLTVPSNFTGNIISVDCWSASTVADPPTFDFGNAICNFILRNYSGGLRVKNYSNPNGKMTFDINSGRLIIDSSVTAGNFKLRGVCLLYDYTIPNNNLIIDSTGMISKDAVVDSINDSIGPQIEYASFNGGVWIDTTVVTSGTSYPVGIPVYPVNNIDDAKIIAESRGFNTFNILSNLTVTSGTNIDYYTIKSNDWWLEVHIEPGVSCLNTNFEKLSLFGELSGIWNVVTNCWVYEITNFAGWLISGSFIEITLAPYCDASLGQSWFDTIVPMYPNEYSIINMNTDTYISCTELNGLYKVNNCISGSFAEFDFSTGSLTIDSSCTGGNIIVRGTGAIINNSTGTNVDIIGLMSKTTIVESIQESIGAQIEYSSFNHGVTVDIILGESGITYPIGTQNNPVNNLSDAISIADNRGLSKLYIVGNITIHENTYTDLEIVGSGQATTTITIDNALLSNITISSCRLTGTFADNSFTIVRDCIIENVYNAVMDTHNCIFKGITRLVGGRHSNFYSCYDGIPGIGVPDIQVNTCTSLGIWDWQGGIRLSHIITPGTAISCMIAQGRLWVDETNTQGNIIVKGLANLVGTMAGTTIDTEGLITLSTISNEVWTNDKALRILGLLQENQYLDNTTYTVFNGQKLLSSGRIRTYSNASSVGTSNNIIATYNIITTWSGDEMQSYKVVKV